MIEITVTVRTDNFGDDTTITKTTECLDDHPEYVSGEVRARGQKLIEHITGQLDKLNSKPSNAA